MTDRDLLAAAASLLLGERWRRPLARLLGVDDRLVRRWAAGDRPVPQWALAALRGHLLARIGEVHETAVQLPGLDAGSRRGQ